VQPAEVPLPGDTESVEGIGKPCTVAVAGVGVDPERIILRCEYGQRFQ
jgi:hypothetical protein